MSIVVRFNPQSVGTEKYDATVAKLESQGDWPPDGLDMHVAFGDEDNLRVSEILDSREQFEAFGERLMPVLEEAGINPGEPDVYEVHNLIKS